jgi:hypothetical protein
MISIEDIEIGCVAIAAFGMAGKKAIEQLPFSVERRQQMAGYIPRLFQSGNWNYVPALLVSLAAFLWIGQLLISNSPTESIANQNPPSKIEPVGTQFVKNQQLQLEPFKSSTLAEWWDAISYHAEYTATGKHLTAYLEYQSADMIVMVKPNRVQLTDLHDFLRNGNLKLSVIMRHIRPDGMFEFVWGTDITKNPALYLGNNRARIVLVDDRGKEQRFYFLVTDGLIWNTDVPGGKLIPYPNFVPAENLGFPAEWEAYDAQH